MVQRKSPFPTGFLGVELFYDGAWQSVDADHDQSGVSVLHGIRSEGGTADASELSFLVSNSDGTYSPRNPVSPLYDVAGRNTPARAHVSLGAPWLDLETAGACATTPHHADLAITGDIDIRWWGERDSWRVAADLPSKWLTTGNQRSWLLRAEANGTLTLFWSTDGTAVLEARSTAALPAWAGRIAIRVTLDVDNGAGGHTTKFEYASALSLAAAPDTSSWTQLGELVEDDAGTTSIFNATSASFTIGKESTSAAGTPPQRVHGWSVRAGITGAQTTATEAIMSDETAGATSFADTTGKTFTVTDGTVSNTHTLGMCEVSEWPLEWNRKGAPSVMTTIGAAGVSRRLGQGAEAVESVLYRAISATAEDADIRAYWPMEDGTDSTVFGAAIGSRAATRGVNVQPAAYADFPGSAPLPTLGTSSTRGHVDAHTSTGEVQARFVGFIPSAGVAAESTLLQLIFVGGTIERVELKIRADGDTGVFGYDFDGNQLAGSTFVSSTSIEGTNQRFSLEVNQDGADVFWRKSTLEPGQSSGATFGQDFTDPQTLGRVQQARFNPGLVDFGSAAVGHLSVGLAITSLFDGVEGDILNGHTGEDAGVRIARLVSENGSADFTVRGRDAIAMGEQQEETLSDLLAEAAAADGGILHDDPRDLGFRYRTLHSLGSQPAVTIPYTDNFVIPFDTTDDDALTRNHVTVQRPAGTRLTHELTDGAMSRQAPPAGVGLYAESLTLNVETDDLADRMAAWRLHIGTWDEGRYPTLGVDLAHPDLLADPLLTRDLLSLTIGDRLVITDPPAWLPPRDIDVIIQGIAVDVTPLHVRLRWTCVPARPHRIAYWNAGHRWSAAGTVLAAGVTSSATSLSLTVPGNGSWTHADGDYDIIVGGELMTVTNVAGDTMTVTRSVNGVVKAHDAGAAVALADPSYYAR
jgi:hypothetical protein